MRTLIGIRVTEETKKLLQGLAQEEHRSLANFVKHAIAVFLKDHKNIDLNETEGVDDNDE